ncbi:FxsC protein [Streptomyces sp. SPB162]|uniref:FxsC protein n=1 Tax=Streptomyces sp. SPB162 TaxID=2940560 RepID=UPI0024060A48|nr:FxsC protein [Streptomyces sp. SPB162]MDF9810789.1 FxsC-like protein [Streptomyces sp. SPB162]
MTPAGAPPPNAATRATSPPVFFLSYVRTPPPADVPEPEHAPDKLVLELFAELNAEVVRLTGAPPGAQVGYLPRPDDSAEQSADALARCRAFVPLCSPRYFASTGCGQQWHAFTSRPGDPRAAIIPALWVPVPTSGQPSVFRNLPQATPAASLPDVARRYAEEGLYGLMALEESNDAYSLIVRRIAERIVETARRSPAAPVDRHELGVLREQPDAFAASPPPRLAIAVLAPRASGLPQDRQPHRYGPSPLDWHPYGGSVGAPLAERMSELARNLGFVPDIRTFHDATAELLDATEPTSPWILVLDPWSLYDEETAVLVRRFDAGDRPWAAVLAPLADDDPQNAQHGPTLREFLRGALPRRRASSRMMHRAAMDGIPNAEVFGRLFSELAESAGLQFLRVFQVPFRTRPSSAAGSGHDPTSMD